MNFMQSAHTINEHQNSKIVPMQLIRPEGKNSNNQENKQQNDDDGSKAKIIQRRKKKQPLFFYWGNIFSILLYSYFNFGIFFIETAVITSIIGIAIICVLCPFFIFASCKMARTVRDMCELYFLIDNIFVAVITSILGLSGLIIIIMPPQIINFISLAFWNLNLFIFAGNSRVIIAYVKYKKWQTIVLKITLCLGFLAYLILAAYFISNDFPKKGVTPELQQKVRNFFFLYIFGLFTLYLQIFSKISDFDGSGDLQYHYQIDEQENYIKVPFQQDVLTNEVNMKTNEQETLNHVNQVHFVAT